MALGGVVRTSLESVYKTKDDSSLVTIIIVCSGAVFLRIWSFVTTFIFK
jgi:hypothetical protein